jgi:aldose sugar dehydrogenase
MAFLGDSGDDILVTERNNGNVKLVIIDGEIQDEPLIDVEVANNNRTNERGLLGMAVIDATDETAAAAAAANSTETTATYVFLYFTESGGGEDGDDDKGVVPTGNRLYRYQLTRGQNNSGITIMDSQLLLDLPAIPGPRYNGVPILATYKNVDNNSNNTAAVATITIYLMIGDLDHRKTQAQNFEDGSPPDGTSGILRVDSEGNPFPDAILVDEEDPDSSMLQYYYAYGIRSSFGIDFDPVTGNLWDTENGPDFGDEINLVEPGFNSGWADVQRLISKLEENLDEDNVVGVGDVEDVELIDFGRGNYSDPEFVWQIPVGVTSIKFFNSPNFGEQYQNDMFVGDINNGILYNFDLNENRTGLELGGALADKVANSNDGRSDIIFGTGFNGITDIEVGPDGYLYILSYGGTMYRIVSEAAATNN